MSVPLGKLALHVMNYVLASAFVVSSAYALMSIFRNRGTDEEALLEDRKEQFFLVLLSFLPVIMLYALSRLWHPSFFERYMLISLLGLQMILAISVFRVPIVPLRRALVVVIGGAFLAQSFLWIQVPTRQPWTEVERLARDESAAVVKLHLYGYRMHDMMTVARYHIDKDEFGIGTYKSIGDLERHVINLYRMGYRANSARLDVIVPVRRKAEHEVIEYLESHGIPYYYTIANARGPLKYIRLGVRPPRD